MNNIKNDLESSIFKDLSFHNDKTLKESLIELTNKSINFQWKKNKIDENRTARFERMNFNPFESFDQFEGFNQFDKFNSGFGRRKFNW